MSIFTTILASIVAIEHLYIMYLGNLCDPFRLY